MWEPLLKLMSPGRRARALHAPMVAWGEARGLSFSGGKEGACSLVGEWEGRPVRIDVQPASRSYMDGLELSARCDLGLDPLATVIVMNRSLKRGIERWGDYLYSQLTNSLQTMADTLPEEVRWLATYRDAGWPGPDEAFWARYAVLTDAPDLARHMIDEATARALMQWPDDAVQADTPLMLLRLRGKVQMRLQLNRPRHPASEVAALDVFARLCERVART